MQTFKYLSTQYFKNSLIEIKIIVGQLLSRNQVSQNKVSSSVVCLSNFPWCLHYHTSAGIIIIP